MVDNLNIVSRFLIGDGFDPQREGGNSFPRVDSTFTSIIGSKGIGDKLIFLEKIGIKGIAEENVVIIVVVMKFWLLEVSGEETGC